MQFVSFPSAGGDIARRVIAVDWSGAATGAGRGIWLADVTVAGLTLEELRGGWTREAVTEHLVHLVSTEPRTVIGLDFSFSLPRWFLEQRGYATAAQLWADVDTCDRWAAECPPPFWGRGLQPTRPADLTESRRLRRTEVETGDAFGVQPKSTFQLGGAGTVGTGSLRGMRVLSTLQQAGMSVWPFDRARLPLVVEVYPRVATRGVRVSDPEMRRAYLDRRGWPVELDLRSIAAGDPNAFDAAVIAFAMARNAREFANLEPARDDTDRLEGRIWAPSAVGGARQEAVSRSTFFAPRPAADRPPVMVRPSQPPWAGPPDGVLGVGVPGQHLIARTDDAAVVLDGLTAYPSGLIFRVDLLFRQPMRERLPRTFHPHAGEQTEGAFRLGVELPDGSRAEMGSPGWPASGAARDVVLAPRSGGGSDRRHTQELWLWPLPGPGVLRVVCSWTDQGIEESAVALDMAPILDAASRSTRFWD